jgi:hypothetical protein
VQNHFGTWNDALRAAGFTPLSRQDHWLGHRGVALREEESRAA